MLPHWFHIWVLYGYWNVQMREATSRTGREWRNALKWSLFFQNMGDIGTLNASQHWPISDNGIYKSLYIQFHRAGWGEDCGREITMWHARENELIPRDASATGKGLFLEHTMANRWKGLLHFWDIDTDTSGLDTDNTTFHAGGSNCWWSNNCWLSNKVESQFRFQYEPAVMLLVIY